LIDLIGVAIVACVIGLLLLILPIVATVFAVKAKRRVHEMQQRMDLLEHRLRKTRAPQAQQAQPEEQAPQVPPLLVAQTIAEKALEQELEPIEKPPPAEPQPEPAEPEQLPSQAEPVQTDAEPPASPEAPISQEPKPPPPAGPKPPKKSIEEHIGLVWFTRIGVLLVIVALGFFFKYMVDNEWLGPWGRLAVGVVAGVAFLFIGQLLARKDKTHPIFVQGSLGLGLALLLVTAYASFAFYHLVPVLLAFGVVAFLALLGGILSIYHRAESILVLSLIAVFLNPVLLSTGVDRPLALFSYLLVMTSGSLVVAVRLNFKITTWLAVAGIGALFAGWYERFFDASPPPPPGMYDQPASELQGHYFPLVRRWVPLLYAALFPLQWVITGFLLQKRNKQTSAVGLYLAGAIAAHTAFAALLFDKPLLLGGVMCALGIFFAWLFIRQNRTNWLGLPMAASFIVLTSLTGQIESKQLLAMMILTGGWSAIYFGVFFRKALKDNRLSSPGMLILLGGAGLGMAILSTIWLMPQHYGFLGLLLAVLSAVYLLVGLAARSVWTIVSAFALSLLGLQTASLVAHKDLPEVQIGFLVVAGLWMLIYIGFVCVDMFVRDAPWDPARLFVLAGAGLGFNALFLTATPESATILRALLSVGCGAIYFLVGLRMHLAGDYGRIRALVPLGLALVFLTQAVTFLFSGVTVTVIWAVEAVVLIYLAAAARQRAWLLAGLAMFFITMLRMFSTDFFWIFEQRDIFWTSDGLRGLMYPGVFFHPQALALAAIGIGMLLAAFAIRQIKDKFFRVGGLVLAILGHLAILTLAITEFRLVFTDLSLLPPGGLPHEEFAQMYQKFDQSLYAQAHRLDMVATVVLAIYAAILLVIGFLFRNFVHRILGIVLFAVTLGKLVLWDVWELARIYQIIVLVAVGLLLLAGGFLYARFGQRLKTLLVDTGKTAIFFVIGLSIFLTASEAGAVDRTKYNHIRAIQAIKEPGDYSLGVDLPLYSASQTQPAFKDIRIVDPSGTEVPFLIRRLASKKRSLEFATTVLDPVLLPDGSSQAVLDLGSGGPRHSQVYLDIDGSDYLRSVKVESSLDGQDFGILTQGAYVFNISTGGPRASRNLVRYPASEARYLRISLLPGTDKQRLRIRGARAQLPRSTTTTELENTFALKFTSDEPPKPGLTQYSLSELPANVPVQALVLQIATQAFVRRARVQGSTRKHAWFPVGGGVVYRVPHEGQTIHQELRLDAQPESRPHLRLIFEDGDNPPLELKSIAAHYPKLEILFRTTKAGEHTLLIGRKKDPGARYDLSELIQRGVAVNPQPASLGQLVTNPDLATKIEQPKKQPWTERNALFIQIGIIVVVLILAAWTVVLIRNSKRKSS
jgi:predicted membrane protein DUF2339/uncharacterized protein DUF3999